MRTGQRTVRVTRLGRFTSGRRPDRNPLRRAPDRVETAVLAVPQGGQPCAGQREDCDTRRAVPVAAYPAAGR
jgi:hypothetical protein